MEIVLKLGLMVYFLDIMKQDWENQRIDWSLLIGLGLWSTALVIYQGSFNLSFLLGLGIFLLTSLIYYVGEKRKKPLLGGADTILLAILGLLFYAEVGLVVLFTTLLLVLHHFLMALLKKRRWKEEIPLGNYLSLISIAFLVKSIF